jgi:hypothetical protein
MFSFEVEFHVGEYRPARFAAQEHARNFGQDPPGSFWKNRKHTLEGVTGDIQRSRRASLPRKWMPSARCASAAWSSGKVRAT